MALFSIKINGFTITQYIITFEIQYTVNFEIQYINNHYSNDWFIELMVSHSPTPIAIFQIDMNHGVCINQVPHDIIIRLSRATGYPQPPITYHMTSSSANHEPQDITIHGSHSGDITIHQLNATWHHHRPTIMCLMKSSSTNHALHGVAIRQSHTTWHHQEFD